VALSFPFFNGWNNWTPADIDAAVATSGRVVQALWEEWPAADSSEHAEVYNVNVRRSIRHHMWRTCIQNALQWHLLLVRKHAGFRCTCVTGAAGSTEGHS